MEDELLTDILAAEGEISRQINTLEQQTAERLNRVRLELERKVELETLSLQSELEKSLTVARQKARAAAEGVLAEARKYALRLKNLENAELDRVLLHTLSRIRPEGSDDRQDEQT